jgi:hypothetical protein
MLKNKPESLDEGDDEAFLSRWSKRKHAQRTIGMAEEALDEDSQALAEQDDLPCDEDMPAIETLTEESDYTGFLSPNVSEELRSLALSKLFHSKAFNVCDGLDDYAEDFTSFAKLGSIITADMKHQLEEARKMLEQQLQATDEETEDLSDSHELSSAADSSEEADQGDADDDQPVEDK